MFYNTLIFSEAIEQVEKMVASSDVEEVCDRLEEISKNRDLALATLMLLYMKLKNVDTTQFTGAELANSQPSFQDLILPPGVKM